MERLLESTAKRVIAYGWCSSRGCDRGNISNEFSNKVRSLLVLRSAQSLLMLC
ncbi:hypothetical protein [Gloeocapsopsis dulcis]|uniref:hypothetical protein n=1 Tax=Gloeocapsopsis dulcis TaxID=2859516 RepID=UPI0012DABC18|nr:hypothetical protein [Gloeocapsopsis dulcis]WNN87546.1 hypothetical protein P0S91_14565 [Gloeocapsopsis dulcis]